MRRESEMILHCPNCNQEISVNADVCRFCGFSMSNYRAMLLKQEESKKRGPSYRYSENEAVPSTGNIIKRLLSAIIAIIIGLLVFTSASNFIKSHTTNTNVSSETTADTKTSNKALLKNTKSTTPKETADPAIKKVSIASVKMSKNSVGVPMIYIVFQNNSDETIDRIDFLIKCYDTYGDELKEKTYLLPTVTNYFFDTNLKPGGKSDKNKFLLLDDYPAGVRAVEIAVRKYHTSSGNTVEVPTDLLQYERYTFK